MYSNLLNYIIVYTCNRYMIFHNKRFFMVAYDDHHIQQFKFYVLQIENYFNSERIIYLIYVKNESVLNKR